MVMLAGVRRVFGALKVTETVSDIQIAGVPADVIARDISRIWSTEKINQWMFTSIGRNSFSFNKFFAPSVHFALTQLLKEKKANVRHRPVRRILEALETETWLKRIGEEHPDIVDKSRLSEMNITLLEHQMRFLDIYNERVPKYGLNGYLLAADPGTGKTINSLALAVCLKASVVVIVSPKNAIRRVWQATIRERFKKEQSVWVADDKKPYNREKYLVVHFEALAKYKEWVGSVPSGNPVVILDESHNLNEESSGRTQNFIDMCNRLNSKHVLWMSGTPLKAMAQETIPILRTIDVYFTDAAQQRFKRIYGRNVGKAVSIIRNRIGLISYHISAKGTVANKTTSHLVKVKIKNGNDYTLEAIRQEIKDFIAKRMAYYQKNIRHYEKIYTGALKVFKQTLETSEEKKAFKTYRKYIEQIRKGYDASAHKEQAIYCNRYEQKVIAPKLPTKEMRDAFKDARSVIKYVKLKVVGEALGKVLGRKRAQCHIDMVPEMGLDEMITNAETKTVIFSSFVSVVKAISDYLKTKGYQPMEVFGEAEHDLNTTIARFEKSEKVNPLIATYQSLSTAVPLTMASCAVFTNAPYRDYEMIQARARVDRLGAPAPIDFYDIVLDTGKEPNVSTRARDILAWSKAQVEEMIGGTITPSVSQGDLSLEALVDQTVERYYELTLEERACHKRNQFDAVLEETLLLSE